MSATIVAYAVCAAIGYALVTLAGRWIDRRAVTRDAKRRLGGSDV